jgi:hypothetical protein
MNILGSLIAPRVGIKIIRSHLQKSLIQNINDFSIYYSTLHNKIVIIINDVTYLYQSDSIKTIIKSLADKMLSKDCIFDAVKIDIEGEKIFASIFYTQNNEKLSLKTEIK